MIELFGHIHPILVHLPIGILLIGLGLRWLSTYPKYVAFTPAVSIVLLTGCITALLSCITGYLLSVSDDYDQSMINWHMWFAIGVLLVSAVLYSRQVNPALQISPTGLSWSLFVLILITGHLGGSLTHGSDYLTRPIAKIFDDDSIQVKLIRPLTNVQQAAAYDSVVQPILETKCYSCHNAGKKKGGLQMNEFALLMKGGKNGPVIKPGNAEQSELIKRLLLPVDHKDHMPPKEKPQPGESQVSLLHWWINNGATTTTIVKDIPQPGKIHALLMALQQPVLQKNISSYLPTKAVKPADQNIVNKLQQNEVTLLPVAQNSNYLALTIINKKQVTKKDIESIDQLKDQVAWIKIQDAIIDDEAANLLSKLTAVNRLHLSGCQLSQKGWEWLNHLNNLEYLNLSGSNVSLSTVIGLTGNKKLHSLYLYQSKVAPTDFAAIRKALPATIVDTGNYQVPLLTSDTALVRNNKEVK